MVSISVRPVQFFANKNKSAINQAITMKYNVNQRGKILYTINIHRDASIKKVVLLNTYCYKGMSMNSMTGV